MSVKLPWDDYLEDAKPCPVCRHKPSEYVGRKPIFMCGIHCGNVYGSTLRCQCGNESCSSNDLHEMYYDWNKRVIPMIERGEGKFSWPSDYMTQNARRIYEELVKANPDAINTDLISREYYADVEFDLREVYRDISNHLDNIGVVIPE